MNIYDVWETDSKCNPINIDDEKLVYAFNLKNAIMQVYQDLSIQYTNDDLKSPINLPNGNKIFVRFIGQQN